MEPIDKQKKILIITTLIVLGLIVGYFFFIGGFDKLSNISEEQKFQTLRPDFTFSPGEVKLADGDIEKLIFAVAHLEGRILSKPVETGDFFEFLVSFPTANQKAVQATVMITKREGRRISLITANKGIIPDTVTRNLVLLSEAMSLLQIGEPIQISIYLHEVTDELRGEAMSNEFCIGRPELCSDSLDVVDRWYQDNLRLTEAVRDGGTLPDNHRIGAVPELVVYDDE